MDEKLTLDFSTAELGVEYCEQRIKDNAAFLCRTLLQPIREHFDEPVYIHDGYRSPVHNNSVGGKPTSWHLYTDDHAAVDFHVNGVSLVKVFDWLRLESKLPFDKVILENNGGVPRCIHIQIARNTPPRRQGYIGGTGDSKSYQMVIVE